QIGRPGFIAQHLGGVDLDGGALGALRRGVGGGYLAHAAAPSKGFWSGAAGVASSAFGRGTRPSATGSIVFSPTTAQRCSRNLPSVAVGIAAMSAASNSTMRTRYPGRHSRKTQGSVATLIPAPQCSVTSVLAFSTEQLSPMTYLMPPLMCPSLRSLTNL